MFTHVTAFIRYRLPAAILLGLVSAAAAWQHTISAAEDADPSVVRIAQGAIKGFETADGLVRFVGVPYAAPPVGALRWKDPAPPAPYNGTYHADTPRSICLQSRFTGPGPDASKSPAGDEDCLYLNIFSPAPKLRGKTPVPVLVWIHGGGNVGGSGMQFDGAPLAAEHRVVVVTLNYRLGAFGFFAHPALSAEQSPGRSGNYGLLDQQAALKWIHQNISAFGGNPANVTIFGESAGGLDVYQQLISPTAAGLFQKAVPQSGAYTRSLRTLATQERAGAALGEAWGCSGSDGTQVAPCLRALPSIRVMAPARLPPGVAPAWAPIIDGQVLIENQIAAFQAGRFHRIPIMAGFTRDEGTALIGARAAATFDEPADFAVQAAALFGTDGHQVAKQYPPAKYRTPAQALAQAYGDHRMVCGALQDADGIAARGGTVYVYEFADEAPADPSRYVLNYPPRNPLIDIGVTHAMDVTYWLGLFQPSATPAQLSLGKVMRAYLVNFARSGNPNGPGLPEWKRYAQPARPVMKFATPIAPSADAYGPHHCAFWYTHAPARGL